MKDSDCSYLLNVLSDIRQKTGVNEKPMLQDLPAEIVKKHKQEIEKAYVNGFNAGKKISEENKNDRG